MRFQTVRATAFGCLQEQKLEFAPGFTVVYGMNESGKSTWHAATYVGLCGIKRGSGASKAEMEFRERYQPWSGGRWKVAAAIQRDNGDCIELHHDLRDKVDCHATDALTGRDMSPDLMFEGMPDGSKLLGLDRKLYQHVACIRQADILGILEDQSGLQSHLQRTVASPDAKNTANAAIRALTEFKSEAVGLERSNSTKPLAAALRCRDAAEEHLKSARAFHLQYLLAAEDAAQRRAEANRLQQQRKLIEARFLLDDAQALEIKLQRMRELIARNPDGAPSRRADEDALAISISQALTGYDQRQPVPDLDGETAADLQAQIDALPERPQGDTAQHESVAVAERSWRAALVRLEQHQSAKPSPIGVSGTEEDVGELRRLAGILSSPVTSVPLELEAAVERADERVATAARTARRSRSLIAAGGVLAAVGLLATLLGFTPGAIALVVGLVLAGAGVLRRPESRVDALVQQQAVAQAALARAMDEVDRDLAAREDAVARARLRGVAADPASLLGQAERIAQAIRLQAAHSAWEQQRSELALAEVRASGALRSALELRGALAGAPLDDSLEAYARDCEARARQLEQASKREALIQRLELRQEREAGAEAARRELDKVVADLEAVSAKVDAAGDHEQQAQALRRWLRDRAARLEADQVAANEWQELETLRQDGSEEQRQRRITELREEAAMLDSEGCSAAIRSSGDRQQLVLAKQREAEAEGAARDLEGECRQLASTLPSVSEAEERYEAAVEQVASVRALDDVLTRTIGFLQHAETSVQRNIAPILTQSVSPRLDRVTNGRYPRVAVDPANLAVTVFDADGVPHPARRLSHGTVEQVYLLVRVALAELFARGGESVPMLLDDVTVESDSVRTKAILSVLHDLSTVHQFVLFTQEDDVFAWAKEHLTGPRDAVLVL